MHLKLSNRIRPDYRLMNTKLYLRRVHCTEMQRRCGMDKKQMSGHEEVVKAISRADVHLGLALCCVSNTRLDNCTATAEWSVAKGADRHIYVRFYIGPQPSVGCR
ncbi:hypothetical protein EVAR_100673_1 [Eumeta japonica]|uniref:Uncharacterized protein n=1 Tax=Eumeta variegata TaxID=151549 RepID=A0A4C2A5P5_EUMVA|nr:hypothetical protein EVAR_100673_1 [Eumeta japonica]